MKDLFSGRSDLYARYRPGYPEALFTYISSLVKNRHRAWDVATGNGQIAVPLANQFEEVYATDISEKQINQAETKENIYYSLQPAESTQFLENYFDFIICGQAVHWFDFDKFYQEVKRVSKPEALIYITGYDMPEIQENLKAHLEYLYHHILEGCWDPERGYLDEHYQTIPFPFEEVPAPSFFSTYEWSIEAFCGYLRTWSGVKHYIKVHGSDPVSLIEPKLQKDVGSEKIQVRFPILSRIGKVHF